MTLDPKQVHHQDQAIGFFATMGTAYGVFIREAQAAGATKRQAENGARDAVLEWIQKALEQAFKQNLEGPSK